MSSWPTSLPDYAWPKELLSETSPRRRRWLEWAFCLAYALGRIVAFFDRRIERVLVIRTDGMGDALLFEPAIRSLSRAFPRAKIHLWAPQLTCELLRHCPVLEHRMTIPRGFKDGNIEYFRSMNWRWTIGFALGRWEFVRAIYPARSPEPLGNWLIASSRSTERWICDGDTLHQFENQRQNAQASATRVLAAGSENVHELSLNASLAQQWKDPSPIGMPMVHLTRTLIAGAEMQAAVWNAEIQRLGGREIVGVVYAGSMKVNSYPDRQWVGTISRLWKQRRAVPVLLGGPNDREHADRLANLLRAARIPCLRMGKTLGILEMSALISRLDGVISVDTGLAHLAIAQYVPTVVLVGGGDPGRFFPWPRTPHHSAITVPTACAGCHNRCNQPEAICITQILPDTIADAYSKLRAQSMPIRLYVDPMPVLKKAG